MNADIRRSISRAARSLDFARAHPIADAGFAVVVDRLAVAVARSNALMAAESDGRLDEHSALALRGNLKVAIRRNYLERLGKIANIAADDHPELQGKFTLPRSDLPNKPFLLAAQALLAAAIAQQELFTALGLGETFIADLTAAVDGFAASTVSAHGGRTGHITANSAFDNVVRLMRREIDVLSTYYRATQAENSEVLVAWRCARNLQGPYHHPGAARQPARKRDPEPVAR